MTDHPQFEQAVKTESPELKSSEQDDPLIGQTIAQRFRLDEKIGEGAWSVVFRAWHTRLEKFVAVKILLPHLVSNVDKLRRFQQEAEAASQLRHKNVVTIFDFGTMPDGRPFFAMDLVEGESLAARLQREGKLSAEESASIALQIAEALTEAHGKGMIHRDIKPANIMIEKNANGEDTVRLADFGIVKIIEPTSLKPEFTQTGDIVGTPHYMSPEQCLGQPLDGRADVYSLACVMYECLAGKRAFNGRNTFDCMNQHISTQPAQIFSSNASNKERQLEQLVFACMSKSVEERPPAEQLSALLQKALNNSLNVARDLKTPRVRKKGATLKPLFVVAAAALVCAVPAAIFMFAPTPTPQRPAQSQSPPGIEETARLPATTFDTSSKKLTFPKVLHQNLEEIQTAITKLRTSDLAKSAALQLQLNEFKRRSTDAAWTFYQPDTALRVVSAEGEPIAPRDARNGIKIKISDKLKSPTILVLASQSPTIWNFSGSNFSQVKKIYFVSSKKQIAKGVPKHIPIQNHNDWMIGSSANPYNTDIRSANEKVAKLTGHSLTTIIPGDSPSRTVSSVIVGPENEEWRAQILLTQLRPLYNQAIAPQRSEYAAWLNANPVRITIPTKFEAATSVGTLSAPKELGETFIPGLYQTLPHQNHDTECHIDKPEFDLNNSLLPRILQVDGQDYSVGGRGPVLLTGGEASKTFEPTDDLAFSPNDNDFTYDSKRNRFLVKDSSSLYEVDLKSGKWKGIDNLKGWDEKDEPFRLCAQIEGMCYKPEDDSIYFLDFRNTNSERATALVRYSVEGKPLQKIPLSLPLPIESNGGNAFTAMYYVKPYFIVISTAPLELYGDKRPYIYILEPATGKVLYNAPIFRQLPPLQQDGAQP